MFQIFIKIKHFGALMEILTFLVILHLVNGRLSISSDLEIDNHHQYHLHQPVTIKAGSLSRVPRNVNNINTASISLNLTEKAVKFVNLNDSHEQLTGTMLLLF